MGKKGNWLSALKRAFTSSSKDLDLKGGKQVPEKKNVKEKKARSLGRSKHGETNPFAPLYREPSSIEKILGDAERDQQYRIYGDADKQQHQKIYGDAGSEQHHGAFEDAEREHQRKIAINPERNRHQRISRDTERELHSKILGDSEREQQNRPHLVHTDKSQRFKKPSLKHVIPNRAQNSAIKIQAAYRGYKARKGYRALKGLMRLQGVMRGQSVKRQTMNAMRCMQLLVRVQSQVRARRLQMMENQNHHQQKSDKESSLGKWSLAHQSEAEDWDDSMLTKEEIDERMQRKVEAVIKRERALAYAYSHQLLKVTPKSAHAVLSDIRSSGYPWWCNWLDRQLPPGAQPTPRPQPPPPATARPGSSRSIIKPARYTSDHLIATTPRSAKPTTTTPRGKQSFSSRWPQHGATRDDDSLTSCPAYTVTPRYMAATASAKAKVRSYVHGDDDGQKEGKRRFFGLGSSIGSMRWGKGGGGGGSVFGGKEERGSNSNSKARHRPTNSIGGMSVDSTVSLPAGVGRKPFR